MALTGRQNIIWIIVAIIVGIGVGVLWGSGSSSNVVTCEATCGDGPPKH